jgi:hypothetical protein
MIGRFDLFSIGLVVILSGALILLWSQAVIPLEYVLPLLLTVFGGWVVTISVAMYQRPRPYDPSAFSYFVLGSLIMFLGLIWTLSIAMRLFASVAISLALIFLGVAIISAGLKNRIRYTLKS